MSVFDSIFQIQKDRHICFPFFNLLALWKEIGIMLGFRARFIWLTFVSWSCLINLVLHPSSCNNLYYFIILQNILEADNVFRVSSSFVGQSFLIIRTICLVGIHSFIHSSSCLTHSQLKETSV